MSSGSSTYAHYSVSELETLRDRLLASLHDRLTSPTMAAGSGRQVNYQQSPDQIRRELATVNAELARRDPSSVTSGPIYIV